jgi:hypothetical protein
LVAALLLAVAVAGGALIPRLLASPPTSLGIALGPGPSRSVVQAPAIPRVRRGAPPQQTTSRPSPLVQAAVATVTPATTVRPKPATSVTEPKHSAAPPPAPPTKTPPPVVPMTPPAPAAARPPDEGPPGHDKTLPAHEKTPRGQEGMPPGHEQTPPDHAEAKGHHDVPGSGHGKGSPQAPPHPVGPHHRHVGHLASPPPRPAPPAPHARPKARPKAGEPRGKGGHGPPPPQVAQGPDHHGHGKD